MSNSATMTNPTNMSNIFNTFIKQIQNAQCGPDCQYAKQENLLEQKYNQAKTNYIKGPSEINTSFKEYYVFQHGQPAYDEHMEEKYKTNSDKMLSVFKDNIKNKTENIEKLLTTYKANYSYYQNISPSLIQYRHENTQLKQDIGEQKSGTFTNERKTVYEEDGISLLYTIRNFLFLLYFIMGIVVIYFMWIDSMAFAKKIALSFVILLFPFVIIKVGNAISYIYLWIMGLLPSNVYMNL